MELLGIGHPATYYYVEAASSCLAHACGLCHLIFLQNSVLELRVDRYYWWISRRPNTTLDGTSW